jgi:hypothetical protein
VAYVSSGGSFGTAGATSQYSSLGFRPALWLRL